MADIVEKTFIDAANVIDETESTQSMNGQLMRGLISQEGLPRLLPREAAEVSWRETTHLLLLP